MWVLTAQWFWKAHSVLQLQHESTYLISSPMQASFHEWSPEGVVSNV